MSTATVHVTEGAAVAVTDDSVRLRHIWVVAVMCDRCRLTPDRAGNWCHPLERTNAD